MSNRCFGVLLVLLLFSAACGKTLFPDGIGINEEQMSSGRGDYSFDAQTVLQSLAQDKKVVFTPHTLTPVPWWTEAPPVQWHQADFYRIAQAFHEVTWQEPIESWQLTTILFGVRCVDAKAGPQNLELRLFKSVPTRQANSRLERTLFLRPQENHISWSGREMYPERSRWRTLDLAQLKIPAEQALQIAETWGGHLERWKVEDRCDISGILIAGEKDNDWRIRYYPQDIGGLLFEIQVDEQTGKTKVTYPKYR
jgi:hypothetical protein